MNYYEHHIGDYAQATGHLTFIEDAAYSRLIRKYYAEEKPIPADLKAAQRLVGARSKEEKEAVQVVLEEFFVLESDGWHSKRCDEEISRFREGAAEREEKDAHERERMRRHREERSRLFAELRELGITPKWDTPITHLRALHEQHLNAPETRTGPEQEQNKNEPATANQTPVSRHQTPDAVVASETVVPINPEQQRLNDLNDSDFAKLVAELYAKVWKLKSPPPIGLLLGNTICLRARSYGPACNPAWWEWYFEQCLADDFLNGTKNSNFRADLTYLIREDTFAKVINAAHLEAAHG